jgi:hypothetical protein
MAHVEVYQGSSSSGSARLPRKNDAVVTGDWFARASIGDLPDLPAEARANCEEHKGNRDGFRAARQKSGESLV